MNGHLLLTTLFFFNDTATTEIYTLSLHDALPISGSRTESRQPGGRGLRPRGSARQTIGGLGSQHDPRLLHLRDAGAVGRARLEEHTSELQSRSDLVCRLLLEKKKQTDKNSSTVTL